MFYDRDPVLRTGLFSASTLQVVLPAALFFTWIMLQVVVLFQAGLRKVQCFFITEREQSRRRRTEERQRNDEFWERVGPVVNMSVIEESAEALQAAIGGNQETDAMVDAAVVHYKSLGYTILYHSWSLIKRETGDYEDEEEECGICMSELRLKEALSILMPCEHLFHKQCLSRWIQRQKKCPICRSSIPCVASINIKI